MGFDDYFDRLATDPPAFWTLSWVADYPGANDFLGLLLGTGSTNNYGHWSSSEFDAAIAQATAATDPAVATKAFDAAQAIVQRDVPVVPGRLRHGLGPVPQRPPRGLGQRPGHPPLRRTGLVAMNRSRVSRGLLAWVLVGLWAGLVQRSRGSGDATTATFEPPSASFVFGTSITFSDVGQPVGRAPPGRAAPDRARRDRPLGDPGPDAGRRAARP